MKDDGSLFGNGKMNKSGETEIDLEGKMAIDMSLFGFCIMKVDEDGISRIDPKDYLEWSKKND